jgi:hypothetical protein
MVARQHRGPAGRRILIVFSDGYPSTGDGNPHVLRSDLRERVAAIGKRGIELVGIGVLTDAVEDFYPHDGGEPPRRIAGNGVLGVERDAADALTRYAS